MRRRKAGADPFEASGAWDEDPRVRRVLAVVAAIPRGKVMAYGDVGAATGLGPRFVAKVMTRLEDETIPWWRVLRADGRCAPEVGARQLRLLRAEGAVAKGAARVAMDAVRYVEPGTEGD